MFLGTFLEKGGYKKIFEIKLQAKKEKLLSLSSVGGNKNREHDEKQE